MEKIMQVLAKETNGKSYNTERYSFDTIGVPSFDYDDNPDKIMKWDVPAETEKHIHAVDLTQLAKERAGKKPLLTYFLDGSRHTYKVDDISYNKQIYPVIAGQVGVGCCKRVNRQMSKEKFYRKLVIALPKAANSDGWGDDAYFESKLNRLNNTEYLKKVKIKFDKLLYYENPVDKRKGKIEDNGIARIQDYMIECEKDMVAQLVREGKIGHEDYLVKDGSLEYKDMRTGREDLRELQKIVHNYEWVIGVSKSFNPESIKDHKGKANANYIADLPLFHRTPVAQYFNANFTSDVRFGVWYLRIRDKRQTRTPFDGVIKVEKILFDDEIQNGIDSELVDLISADLINERTPTCYGTDRRWANHLYPVFLTESYVKSLYMSSEMFLHLF